MAVVGSIALVANTSEVWGPAGGVCPTGDPNFALIDSIEAGAVQGIPPQLF